MAIDYSRGLTDAEIELRLNWPSNIVTARRNDLIDRGLIVVRWPECRRFSIKPTRDGKKPLRVTLWLHTSFASVWR